MLMVIINDIGIQPGCNVHDDADIPAARVKADIRNIPGQENEVDEPSYERVSSGQP